MLRIKTTTGLLLILMAAVILAGCQQATPVAPTMDANAIYTQAAATVAAGLAQTQASQPSATPQPATATPTPTNQVEATVAQPGPTNGTPAGTTPGAPTATVLVLTPIATNTKSAPQSSVPDKAEWVSQSPTDNSQIQVNSKFLVKYVFKNTGTTTWTTAYTFRYYAGDKMGSPNDLNLTKEVKPNQTVEIVFEATAPSTKAKTNSIFVLTNADGQNFYSVFLALEIID